MTERERILAVFNGKTPDRVPYYLDLSHFYYEKFQKPWDLLNGYAEPEQDLIDYNRKFGAGFYVPNQMIQFTVQYAEGVSQKVWSETINGNPEIHWRLETKRGAIERIRVWEKQTYSWPIKKWGIHTEEDLRILGDALSSRTFLPQEQNYRLWDSYVGDGGIIHLMPGYSAMGLIMHYWMGMENTLYACFDWQDTMHEVIDKINANILDCIRMLSKYNAPSALMGDNFSGDCQPPDFFSEWSAPFYREAVNILHNADKKVGVHIDGRLRGAIRMIGETGVDIIDAVTPAPMGDLTAKECREEAGPKLILSGGVPPNLWLPNVSEERFRQGVMDWLALKEVSPAFIANAGDQVPPGAVESRITLMAGLVEQYGKY
jgi:hypothetical protein